MNHDNLELPDNFRTTESHIFESLEDYFEESRKADKRNLIILIITLLISLDSLIVSVLSLIK